MLRLGTKAETLERLYGKMNYAKILPQYHFTTGEWKNRNWEFFWNQCLNALGNTALIVRSSSLHEDTSEISQAGKFESVSDVRSEQEFIKAVEQVIASFDDNNDDNQILVQSNPCSPLCK